MKPGALLAASLALVAALSLACAPAAGPPPPEPALAGLSQPLRAALETARADVLAAPDSADAWGHLGSLFDAHSLYAEALVCYERATELAPGDYRWLYLAAVVADFQGHDLADIETRFAAALAKQSEYPPLWYRFGDALLRQGDATRAVACYERAVELDGDFALAQRGLGQALLALERTDEALRHLERSRAIDPSDSVVHAALARAYHLAGDAEASRAATERSRSTQPVLGVPDPVRYAVDQLALDPLSLNRRVTEALAQGDLESAERDLAVLAQLFPDDPGQALRHGECLVGLQRWDAAMRPLERAAELGSDVQRGRAHSLLADLLQERGDPAAALPHRRRAVEAQPARADFRNALALTLGRNGDLEGALVEFEASASLETATSELHHNWGTALLRLGRVEEATLHFQAALALEPSSPATLFNLGSIREGQGRSEEAIQLYLQAVPLDPSGPAAQRLQELGVSAPPR